MTLLFGIFIAYSGLGFIAMAGNVKDITKKDTWSNLWEHRKLALRSFIGWPLVLKAWLQNKQYK